MDSMQTAREVLGWCTALNIGVLVLSSLILMFAGSSIRQVHSKMFGLSESDLSRGYFQSLAQYKTAILIFNLAPYLALRIVG